MENMKAKIEQLNGKIKRIGVKQKEYFGEEKKLEQVVEKKVKGMAEGFNEVRGEILKLSTRIASMADLEKSKLESEIITLKSDCETMLSENNLFSICHFLEYSQQAETIASVPTLPSIDQKLSELESRVQSFESICLHDSLAEAINEAIPVISPDKKKQDESSGNLSAIIALQSGSIPSEYKHRNFSQIPGDNSLYTMSMQSEKMDSIKVNHNLQSKYTQLQHLNKEIEMRNAELLLLDKNYSTLSMKNNDIKIQLEKNNALLNESLTISKKEEIPEITNLRQFKTSHRATKYLVPKIPNFSIINPICKK